MIWMLYIQKKYKEKGRIRSARFLGPRRVGEDREGLAVLAPIMDQLPIVGVLPGVEALADQNLRVSGADHVLRDHLACHCFVLLFFALSLGPPI